MTELITDHTQKQGSDFRTIGDALLHFVGQSGTPLRFVYAKMYSPGDRYYAAYQELVREMRRADVDVEIKTVGVFPYNPFFEDGSDPLHAESFDVVQVEEIRKATLEGLLFLPEFTMGRQRQEDHSFVVHDYLKQVEKGAILLYQFDQAPYMNATMASILQTKLQRRMHDPVRNVIRIEDPKKTGNHLLVRKPSE